MRVWGFRLGDEDKGGAVGSSGVFQSFRSDCRALEEALEEASPRFEDSKLKVRGQKEGAVMDKAQEAEFLYSVNLFTSM